MSVFKAIDWHNQQLHLLDQRLLPTSQTVHSYNNAAQVAEAITSMVVRGAPAIGIAAAYGYALDALANKDLDEAYRILAASRPTAINLFWALERMRCLKNATAIELVAEAQAIHAEDLAANLAMGQFGASLISHDSLIYTHCNTGALATGGHGTALGIIRSAFKEGNIKQVYAGETRPWLQGARLTAWELQQEGIPATLVCDNAAAHLFKQQPINWVIVGADRIAANGDTANKIGTYSLAVLAQYHQVKFMVAAPSSSFDLSLENGQHIPIEQRPSSEVTEFQGKTVAPIDMPALNPSFDVTPADLIDAIVTEKGIIYPPFKDNIHHLLGTS